MSLSVRESPAEILVIQLSPRETECIVCGVDLVDCRQGVPIYEDLLLYNGHTGDWGGFDACSRCYAYQSTLTIPISLAEARAHLLDVCAARVPARELGADPTPEERCHEALTCTGILKRE